MRHTRVWSTRKRSAADTTAEGVDVVRAHGHSARQALVLIAVLITAVSGCASEPAPAPPAGPIHYATAMDLETRVTASMMRDGTATTTTAATTRNGPGAVPVQVAPRDGAISFRQGAIYAHAFFPVSYEQVPQNLVEVIMLNGIPNGTAFVVPPSFLGLGMPVGRSWVGPLRPAEPTVTHSDGAAEDLALFATGAVLNTVPTRGFNSTVFGTSAQLVGVTDESIGGLPAVRYSLHVDIARAAQVEPDPRKKDFLEKNYLQPGTLTLDTTVWIDASDRPLRASTLTSGTANAQTLDITYRNWGTQVPIEAPPPGTAASF